MPTRSRLGNTRFIPELLMWNQSVVDLSSSLEGPLRPPEAAFPAPSENQREGMFRTVRLGRCMIREHREAKFLDLVKQIDPVHHDVVLDLVPSLEECVRIAALANVVGR